MRLRHYQGNPILKPKVELMKCNGVNDTKVSHKDGKAIVNINVFEFGVDEIIEAVKKAGFSDAIGH